MPLNRAQLRSLTLMKIVFPQVLWKMQQMICKCLALVFPSSVFKFSAHGTQHFAFLTCCHLHTCCHFLYACMCVRLCVSVCDCCAQLFWRHVLIIKHRCHKHSHTHTHTHRHTHALSLAPSCNKHLVVYPVICWSMRSGQYCTAQRVCISLIYDWLKCFNSSFHNKWRIFNGYGKSSCSLLIIWK